MYSTTALTTENIVYKAKQFWLLSKARLSGLVVFSGAFGFLMASSGSFEWTRLLALIVGSFLITAGANTINQILERALDRKMKRTSSRPLPTGTLTPGEAKAFAWVAALIGAGIMVAFVNVLSAGLALFSLILYAFVYTPLKQVTPLAVLVGAFPGAFPPLIGWVAMTGSISVEAMIIFGIQFFWQFPHFWAIAWVGNEDYTKAGFKMLPSAGGRDLNTATQIMLYTLFLLPLSFLPLQAGMAGVYSAGIAGVATLVFLAFTFNLIWKQNNKAALMVMFYSFIYLPIVQLALLFDKV